MTTPEDVGQAQRRTASGGGLQSPLNLIHRTKPSNPLGMRVSSLLGGLFSSPCGVWVHLEKMRSGVVWARPCISVTRATVLGGAYGAKSKP